MTLQDESMVEAYDKWRRWADEKVRELAICIQITLMFEWHFHQVMIQLRQNYPPVLSASRSEEARRSR